jgi:hypothetical protein
MHADRGSNAEIDGKEGMHTGESFTGGTVGMHTRQRITAGMPTVSKLPGGRGCILGDASWEGRTADKRDAY